MDQNSSGRATGSGANGGRGAYSLDTRIDIAGVSTMLSVDDLFKGRHFDREIITLCREPFWRDNTHLRKSRT